MDHVLLSDKLHGQSSHERIDSGAEAWIAVALTVGAWMAVFAGAPSFSRYGFVATSLICALYLYWRHEIQYVSFTWWLYFLAPFIRRVVDYRIGFDPSSLMLAAPLFASALPCVDLLKLRRLDLRSLPFVLAMLGVTFGLAVSLVMRTPIATTAQYFLAWLGPVAFGYLLYDRWPRYLDFRNSLQSTFKWGLLVMGSYGVIQYLYAPVWDRFWMENLGEKISSFGNPEPLGIRVFSTMNGPQPFALVIVVGLAITFYERSSLLQKAAWCAGYAGLLLSMARSAWLEWAIALGALAFLGKSRKALSGVLVAILIMGVIGLIIARLPMGQAVVERLQTLSNVEEDGSGQDRLAGYQSVLKSSLGSPFGQGWGIETDEDAAMPIHDSAAVEVILSSGWFGFVAFYGTLILAVLIVLTYVRRSVDLYISITAALLVGLLVESIFNSMMGGANQLGLMTIVGLGLAATRYLEFDYADTSRRDIYN